MGAKFILPTVGDLADLLDLADALRSRHGTELRVLSAKRAEELYPGIVYEIPSPADPDHRAPWWGEAEAAEGREVRPVSEPPASGVLLPEEPDRPSARRAAEAAAIAARLAADPELAAAVEAQRG